MKEQAGIAQEWLQVEVMLRERFGKVPDMEGILYLIGINELGGSPPNTFSKEQKQDLIHVGVCTLLSIEGYYEFLGRDADGWPHFEVVARPEMKGIAEQEAKFRELIIHYFAEH